MFFRESDVGSESVDMGGITILICITAVWTLKSLRDAVNAVSQGSEYDSQGSKMKFVLMIDLFIF